jgi:putative phosphoesterase
LKSFRISGSKYTVGVISDTHGLLRDEVLEKLRNSDLILHAGDIGDAGIISRLIKISPVIAVRGNVDNEPSLSVFPETEIIRIENYHIFMLHKLTDMNFNPDDKGFDIVIFGHSHKPVNEKRGKVFYLNPGSAGKKRFKLPVTMAVIKIDGKNLKPEIIDLHL